MAGVRRSGRISKQVPILLLGTDTSGRVLSEETHTLVLSLHGAGIRSRNKFAPDEVLTMRLVESGREAEIKLVGRLGEDARSYVYGVAFCDDNLDFWQIEFPPASGPHPRAPGVDLECCFCNERIQVQQNEIESDVLLTSQTVLRYCQSCGQTTAWKRSTGPPPSPRPKPNPPSIPVQPAEVTSAFTSPAPAVVSAPTAPQSAYARSVALDELVPAAAVPQTYVAPAVASKQVTSPATPPPSFAPGGKKNMRRHVRTRVNFTACVRLNASSEEIVECENISKGGLCFHSRKRYEEDASIEVAVPYYPGQPSVFVRATIRRVEELPALNLFRYGVAYA